MQAPVSDADLAFTYAWWLTGDTGAAEAAVRRAAARLPADGGAEARRIKLLAAVRADAIHERTMCPASELAVLHDAQGLDLVEAARVAQIDPADARVELAHGRLEALLETVREPFAHPERLGGLAVGNPPDVAHSRQCGSCGEVFRLLAEGREALRDIPPPATPPSLRALLGLPEEAEEDAAAEQHASSVGEPPEPGAPANAGGDHADTPPPAAGTPPAADLRPAAGTAATDAPPAAATAAGGDGPTATDDTREGATGEDSADAGTAGEDAARSGTADDDDGATRAGAGDSGADDAAAGSRVIQFVDAALDEPYVEPEEPPAPEAGRRWLLPAVVVLAVALLAITLVANLRPGGGDPAVLPTAPSPSPTIDETVQEGAPAPAGFAIDAVGLIRRGEFIPAGPGIVLTPTDRVRVAVRYSGATDGVVLAGRWTVDGRPFRELRVALSSRRSTHVFTAPVPDGGWPAGLHHVVLTVGNTVVATVDFRVV